jgi:uncharacterized membrane protein YraQ (UPF0718 family)
MMNSMRRYRWFILSVFGVGILTLVNRDLGIKAINTTAYSLKEMILVIPPIFVLLGLMDIWVPKETMIRYMGEGSGVKGTLLAIFIGSAAAGPLYGAFPIAAVFMKKGVSYLNVLVFIGAWSTTKIPMFLFEMTSLGAEFAVTRLLIDLPGIILIAWIIKLMTSKDELRKIYEHAASDHK